MMPKLCSLLALILFFSSNTGLLFAKGGPSADTQEQNSKERDDVTLMSEENAREMIIGRIIKHYLESSHFSGKKIDKDLSKQAFAIFLERMDYGKQFYLQSDVKELKKSEADFSNQMLTGNLKHVDRAYEILNSRVAYIQNIVFAALKKKIDLKKTFSIETDPKKRNYARNLKDLEDFWMNQLHFDVLNKYAELKDEQEGVESLAQKRKKDKERKKKKKANIKEEVKEIKIKSPSELEQSAREAVTKSYERIFSRLTKEKKDERVERFFNSIAKAFDPHTGYMAPEDKEDFDIDMSGKLEGIGALLREDGSYIKVERVVPGSAAWKQKELKGEDIILKVGQGKEEPVDVVDMSINEAVKLIRGKKGTEVRLTVKKPNGLIKVIPIIRDVVELEEAYAKSATLQIKDEKGKTTSKVGYIHLPKFYRDFNDRKGRNVTDDTRKALLNLKKQNVKAVILDMRNNGGGALNDATMISGLFVKTNPVVQVKNHMKQVEVLTDEKTPMVYDGPLIVLINKFSASASEIVAGALQDFGRAIVVGGNYSHGKGTVQAVIDLDPSVAPLARHLTPIGALKLTIQMFYRVTGSSTQYKGIIPDIILPDPYSHLESGERYLDHSLNWEEVDGVKFAKWQKHNYPVASLIEKSKKRVAEHDKFQKIIAANQWYQKRKEKSERSYNLKSFLAERAEIREKTDSFDLKEINPHIIVTSVDALKDNDAKERFQEYREELQKDPIIEETLRIIEDL